MSELASFIKTTPSSLQRELKTLVERGTVRSRRDGNRIYIQAETDSPIFVPIRDLLVQTLGVTEKLKEVLEVFGEKIEIAFIYGSVARKEESAQSDVDLMIIGSSGLAEISPIVRELEIKFEREINPTCYSLAEFRNKLVSGNHFLTEVLRQEKIFLKGDQDELANLNGEQHDSPHYSHFFTPKIHLTFGRIYEFAPPATSVQIYINFWICFSHFYVSSIPSESLPESQFVHFPHTPKSLKSTSANVCCRIGLCGLLHKNTRFLQTKDSRSRPIDPRVRP